MQSIRIIVENICFKDCLKMLMEMAGSQSSEGRGFQDNGPDEQNAHGPNVEVDRTRSIPAKND